MGSRRRAAVQINTYAMKNGNFKKTANSILKRIKESKKILLSLHRSPDGDSIGANSAFFEILRQFGKEVTLASPDPIPENLMFVPYTDKVLVKDIFEIGFEKFDLLVLLDSASWDVTSHRADLPSLPPKEKSIIIDHHATNERMGEINLVMPSISSACELVFILAKTWKIKFNKELSQSLLTGMATDTGIFQFLNTSPAVLKNAAFLIENKASLDLIVFNTMRSNSIIKLKLLGKLLGNLQIDKKHKFAYATLSKEEIHKLDPEGMSGQVREFCANLFMQSIEGTEFGFAAVEEERDVTRVSLRSRRGFDVSKIAVELGGGGHKAAAGTRINLPLKEALKKAIEVSRKYSKK